MSKHTIQISDEKGQTFKVVVSIGWLASSNGNWFSLDKGSIRFSQGRVEYRNAGTDNGRITHSEPTLRHVLLYESPQSSDWGIRLNDYADWLGVNNQGMGWIVQPWVLNIEPYRISWVLVD